MFTHVCIYIYICIDVCLPLSLYNVYIYIYICMHIYIYIYMYILKVVSPSHLVSHHALCCPMFSCAIVSYLIPCYITGLEKKNAQKVNYF